MKICLINNLVSSLDILRRMEAILWQKYNKEVTALREIGKICLTPEIEGANIGKNYQRSIQMNHNLHSRRYMYMYYRRISL